MPGLQCQTICCSCSAMIRCHGGLSWPRSLHGSLWWEMERWESGDEPCPDTVQTWQSLCLSEHSCWIDLWVDSSSKENQICQYAKLYTLSAVVVYHVRVDKSFWKPGGDVWIWVCSYACIWWKLANTSHVAICFFSSLKQFSVYCVLGMWLCPENSCQHYSYTYWGGTLCCIYIALVMQLSSHHWPVSL